MSDPEAESPEEVSEMYAANGRRLAKENQTLRARVKKLERRLGNARCCRHNIIHALAKKGGA